MKKNLRKLALTCLTFSIVAVSNCMIPVQAATNNNAPDGISEIETIAKSAPQYVLGSDYTQWSDVDVVSSKPLYDFNNNLIAYSLDLKSNIDNENAFVIVSTSQEDEPILEFSTTEQSPYDKITDNNQICIFDGFQGYYSHGKSTSKYHDIMNNKDLDNDEIKIHINNSKNKKHVASRLDIAKQNRVNLKHKATVNFEANVTTGAQVAYTAASASKSSNTANSTPATIVTNKILSGVPDYYWHNGCSPTSAAMVLEYDYSSKLSNITYTKLEDELISAMKTDSTGGTVPSMIPTGITKVMSAHGVSVSSTNYTGLSNATFDKAVSEIKNSHPFVATLMGSTETSHGYPNGFGKHSMACIGYNITTSTNSSGVTTTQHFIAVHDTAQDGTVYCNYDSSALGTPTWTTVH